ncbi:MAG: hypothetical protein J6D21_12290 [Clostridia bacterium]|nr:hypothetical protein [Clostridia bacterium]
MALVRIATFVALSPKTLKREGACKKVDAERALGFDQTFSKVCGCGQRPRKTAFSFRQAFSFGPFASKEKASNAYRNCHVCPAYFEAALCKRGLICI